MKISDLLASLNIQYPIIQAPMAGGPCTPELVSAVSECGGLGSIGAGYLSAKKLGEEIKKVKKLTNKAFSVMVFARGLLISVMFLQACSMISEDGSRELGDKKVDQVLVGKKIVAKLGTGETCAPVKFNNNSEVALQCSDGSIAIWSEGSGIKSLPKLPEVLSILPANVSLDFKISGFSDDGKILLNPTQPLSRPDIEEIPPVSYLYDGKSFVKLDKCFDAISDNGEYLAGREDHLEMYLFHNLNPVNIEALPSNFSVLSVKAVNNAGEILATLAFENSVDSYNNYYAARIGSKELMILSSSVQDDTSSSSAVDINNSGEILIDRLEGLNNPRERVLVVAAGVTTDVYPEDLSVNTVGVSLNDNKTVLFSIEGEVFISEINKPVISIEQRVGHAISSFYYLINDKNQLLVSGEGEGEFYILEID